MAAIRAGCAYTGVTLSDVHAKELRKHIHMAAFQAAAAEGDPLYDPDLVLSLRQKTRKRMTLDQVEKQIAAGDANGAKKPKKPKVTSDEASGSGDKAAEGKAAEGKAKAKAKAKAKGKAKAKAKSKETDPFKEENEEEEEADEEEDWDADEEDVDEDE